jgi:cell division protein FtsB
MPLVVRDGKVLETGVLIGSEGWVSFLQGSSSFRYETASHGGYTATKQYDYWYASRKYQGRLYRKYIGTTAELNVNQLDAAAITLAEMIEQSTVKERTAVKPASLAASDDNQQLQKKVESLTQEVERLKTGLQDVEQLKAEVAELRGKLAA